MRRFVTLAVLLLCSLPFGMSIAGCKKALPVTYCNGGDSGPILGQIAAIRLEPALTGLSLNQGQISNSPAPAATDCKGNNVSGTFSYSTSDTSILDIQPSSGRLCAGTWNRNTGPVADYTYCTATAKSGLVYLYAQDGATSNPLPVFIHPVVSSIVLGPPSDCKTDSNGVVIDPASNCSPAALLAASSSATLQSCKIDSTTGCCTTPAATTVAAYNPNSCVSQGGTVQLAARAYAGGGSNPTKASCLVGHLAFAPQLTTIVSVDQNGIATAGLPGSTLVAANLGQTSSSAGYFATCPPASISLTAPGTGATDPTNVVVGQNIFQPLVAVVKDTNGVTLNGLTLTYNSSTPATVTAGTDGNIHPTFAGVADLTAVCMPPSCNPAPINTVGLNGNGKPITSNPVTVTTPGTVNTILYVASTQSQYILPVDFTTGGLTAAPVRLPFVPNSLVSGPVKGYLYLGTDTELMIFATANSSVFREDATVSGKVLSASPDESTLVVSDPKRQLIYLYSVNPTGTAGSIASVYGGVATSAQWSPDSQTVYIATTTNQMLVHSSFTGWTTTTLPVTSPSAAILVPSIGAYFAGSTTTGVSYCPSTTVISTTTPPTTTNVYYPVVDMSAATTDQIIATNDGKHVLGASVTGPSNGATLVDLHLTLPVPASATQTTSSACPSTVSNGYFQSTYTTQPMTGVIASSITGVAAASDTSIAYVTYTGTGGVLPGYIPSSTGTGSFTEVPLLTNGAPASTSVAPVAGVFSTDNLTFYAGTSGDNKVHLIVNQKDTGTLSPNLPGIGGGTAVPNLLIQKAKSLL